MGKRRAGRERALQVLFELEFNESTPGEIFARDSASSRPQASSDEYASRLVGGILGRRDEIDLLIQSLSKNWRLERMGFVDRNILRIAVYEMLEDAFLAPAIIINEALEIAKRYSGEATAVFINGVLDAVRRKIRPDDPPKERPENHERTEKPKPQRPRARRNPPPGRPSQN